MKKFLTMILLFLSIFEFSNAKTKTLNNEKQAVINSFYEFMKFHTSPENVKKNVFDNSVDNTNEILGNNVSNQFKKDLKLAKKQGKNLDTLFNVIKVLEKGEKLDDKYRDHSLSGKYKGTRECHIEPD